MTRYLHTPLGMQQQQTGSTWRHMLADGLGSERVITDTSRVVQESRSFGPYGEVWGTTGTDQGVFGFTGEQTDANSLIYLRARYYNPTLGIFPSLDPLEGAMHLPLSLNRYSWVQGNVVNMVDPSGLASTPTPGKWNTCFQQPIGRKCSCYDDTQKIYDYVIGSQRDKATARQLCDMGYDSFPECGSISTVVPTATASLIKNGPLTQGCNVKRTFAQHGANDLKGIDYQIDSDYAATAFQDILTRQGSNMLARRVRSLTDGIVINVVRERQTILNPASYGEAPTQPGEDMGITTEVLVYNTQVSLIIQYTHVFPTLPKFVPGASLFTQAQAANPPTFLNRGTWYGGLATLRANNLQYAPSIKAEDEIGYYASIGMSTIGPHLHVSFFIGPPPTLSTNGQPMVTTQNGQQTAFGNWLVSSDRGGPINLQFFVPCP